MHIWHWSWKRAPYKQIGFALGVCKTKHLEYVFLYHFHLLLKWIGRITCKRDSNGPCFLSHWKMKKKKKTNLLKRYYRYIRLSRSWQRWDHRPWIRWRGYGLSGQRHCGSGWRGWGGSGFGNLACIFQLDQFESIPEDKR